MHGTSIYIYPSMRIVYPDVMVDELTEVTPAHALTHQISIPQGQETGYEKGMSLKGLQ